MTASSLTGRLRKSLKITKMATITERKATTVTLTKSINDQDVNIELIWIDGYFKEMRIQESIGRTTMTLYPDTFKLLRDLMGEVITATNNPPVGCDPV